MARWIRSVIQTIKVFLIFVICTLFFYFGLVWMNEEYENYHRYDQPEGKAIKVSSENDDQRASLTFVERLRLFYQMGE